MSEWDFEFEGKERTNTLYYIDPGIYPAKIVEIKKKDVVNGRISTFIVEFMVNGEVSVGKLYMVKHPRFIDDLMVAAGVKEAGVKGNGKLLPKCVGRWVQVETDLRQGEKKEFPEIKWVNPLRSRGGIKLDPTQKPDFSDLPESKPTKRGSSQSSPNTPKPEDDDLPF